MRRICLAIAMFVFTATPALAATDWSVRVAPFDQVFPALELSQARRSETTPATDHVLGAGSGLIAVHVRSRHAGERVTLRLDIPVVDAPQRFTAILPETNTLYELHPPLNWDMAQLRATTSAVSTRLTVNLSRDGVDAGMRVVGISMRPLDEALYFVRDGTDSVDLSWIFAAYVDERSAVVDQILDSAQRSGIVAKFDGYAQADARVVQRQVWAIWQALSAHGIRYSGADPAIERGPHVFSQRVRFLADTWADRSANCVDGSVLIASVLQRIGVRSFLVLVPGHAFLGYYTDADSRHAAYLETTLLGAHVRSSDPKPTFATDIDLDRQQRVNLAGFVAALAAGREHHARVAAKLDGQHRPDYAVIDIAAARGFGIQPIAAGGINAYPAPNRRVNAAPPSASDRDTSSVPR
ncbi:MAG: hypothetical protein ABI304_01185 [Rudaea sp.]